MSFVDEYDQRSKDLVAANRAAMMEAIAAAGATLGYVAYTGSGDSGQVEEVWVATGPFNDAQPYETPGAIDLDHTKVWLPFTTGSYVHDEEHPDGHHVLTVTPNMPLDDALERFAHAAIGATGHSGYENEEGGFGYMLIDVAANTVKLDHHDNFIQTVDYSEAL